MFDAFRGQRDRRLAEGADPTSVDAEVIADLRQNQLGGRVLSAMTGSAPISGELRGFVETLLDVHLTDGYGATECGLLFVDGRALRPQVIDYKLVDVASLAKKSEGRQRLATVGAGYIAPFGVPVLPDV